MTGCGITAPATVKELYVARLNLPCIVDFMERTCWSWGLSLGPTVALPLPDAPSTLYL